MTLQIQMAGRMILEGQAEGLRNPQPWLQEKATVSTREQWS